MIRLTYELYFKGKNKWSEAKKLVQKTSKMVCQWKENRNHYISLMIKSASNSSSIHSSIYSLFWDFKCFNIGLEKLFKQPKAFNTCCWSLFSSSFCLRAFSSSALSCSSFSLFLFSSSSLRASASCLARSSALRWISSSLLFLQRWATQVQLQAHLNKLECHGKVHLFQ